jgi:hypothetical protein
LRNTKIITTDGVTQEHSVLLEATEGERGCSISWEQREEERMEVEVKGEGKIPVVKFSMRLRT